MEQATCPFCHFQLLQSYYFCPNCGKKINEPPVSNAKALGVCLISILLPPLGLWPGVKYLFAKEQKTRIVGAIAIALTILSTVITIWLSIGLLNNINQSVNSQMNQYQNLGY
jgi:hypothetical protein